MAALYAIRTAREPHAHVSARSTGGERHTPTTPNQTHVPQAETDRETVLVAHDGLRLEVARLQGALGAAAQEVLGLEARRVALVGSLELRRAEVEQHR